MNKIKQLEELNKIRIRLIDNAYLSSFCNKQRCNNCIVKSVLGNCRKQTKLANKITSNFIDFYNKIKQGVTKDE